MSSSILFGIAVYVAMEAWKEKKEEDRIRNLQLPHKPRKQLRIDPLSNYNSPVIEDCLEEVDQGDYDDRY